MDQNSKLKTQHIDNVQVATVGEHFKLILNDETLLDSGSSDVTRDDLPDWYNRKLYKQAQDFINRYLAWIFLQNIIGLIIVFAIPHISKVLSSTKESNTICSAFKRYIQTSLHMYKFFTSDPDDPDSDWYRSMNVVRWKHKINSKKCEYTAIRGIYHRDMVLTQCAFMAYALTKPEAIGIRMTPEEGEAFNHYWRVTGYMLGIPDRLNICRKTVAETRKLCQKLIDELYVDFLNNPPSDFHTLASATLDGLSYIDFNINRDAIMELIYRIHDVKYKKPLAWKSWLNMKYRNTLISLSFLPYIGSLIRLYVNTLLRIMFWYSENYGTLHARLVFDRKDLRINLYPTYK